MGWRGARADDTALTGHDPATMRGGRVTVD